MGDDKPHIPLSIRLFLKIVPHEIGETGKPIITKKRMTASAAFHFFGSILLFVIAISLLNFLLPSFKTLRHFLISTGILLYLYYTFKVGMNETDIDDIYDTTILDAEWDRRDRKTNHFYSRFLVTFHTIWFAAIPAFVALYTGGSLLLSAINWLIARLF